MLELVFGAPQQHQQGLHGGATPLPAALPRAGLLERDAVRSLGGPPLLSSLIGGSGSGLGGLAASPLPPLLAMPPAPSEELSQTLGHILGGQRGPSGGRVFRGFPGPPTLQTGGNPRGTPGIVAGGFFTEGGEIITVGKWHMQWRRGVRAGTGPGEDALRGGPHGLVSTEGVPRVMAKRRQEVVLRQVGVKHLTIPSEVALVSRKGTRGRSAARGAGWGLCHSRTARGSSARGSGWPGCSPAEAAAMCALRPKQLCTEEQRNNAEPVVVRAVLLEEGSNRTQAVYKTTLVGRWWAAGPPGASPRDAVPHQPPGSRAHSTQLPCGDAAMQLQSCNRTHPVSPAPQTECTLGQTGSHGAWALKVRHAPTSLLVWLP